MPEVSSDGFWGSLCGILEKVSSLYVYLFEVGRTQPRNLRGGGWIGSVFCPGQTLLKHPIWQTVEGKIPDETCLELASCYE